MTFVWVKEAVDSLNMKMPSYQYRDPHVEDKTASLIFNMGIHKPGKDGLYIEAGPWCPNDTHRSNWGYF